MHIYEACRLVGWEQDRIGTPVSGEAEKYWIKQRKMQSSCILVLLVSGAN